MVVIESRCKKGWGAPGGLIETPLLLNFRSVTWDGTDFVQLNMCYISTLTIGKKLDTYGYVIKFFNKELDTEVKYLHLKKKP